MTLTKNKLPYIAAAITLATLTITSTLQKKLPNVLAAIYDSMIVGMTELWYRCVLQCLADGSVVLDVGVGTAGALLKCNDIIKSKNLKIIGIDYNSFYIQAAQEAIHQAGMEGYISVVCIDIYNKEKVGDLLNMIEEKKEFDAVYFSGSFSLLPKPVEALNSLSAILAKDTGRIYITQTFQRRTPIFMNTVKPMLKYLTTIDFGRLVSEEEIMELYNKSELAVEKHEVIKGSLDNRWQAAYLSVLKIP